MDPNIWGPHAWHFLHAITLSYPINPTEKQKKNYKLFFHNLVNILPCSNCSINYTYHIKQLPIEPFLKNRKTLVSWLIQIHNMTNKHLNKNIFFTLNNFTEYYKKIYSTSNNTNSYLSYICYFITLTIILIIFFCIFYNQIKYYFYLFKNYICNIQTLN